MPRRTTRKQVAAETTPAACSGSLPGDGAEDEAADPVGDGRSDADLAASLPATACRGGTEPDPKLGPDPDPDPDTARLPGRHPLQQLKDGPHENN